MKLTTFLIVHKSFRFTCVGHYVLGMVGANIRFNHNTHAFTYKYHFECIKRKVNNKNTFMVQVRIHPNLLPVI